MVFYLRSRTLISSRELGCGDRAKKVLWSGIRDPRTRPAYRPAMMETVVPSLQYEKQYPIARDIANTSDEMRQTSRTSRQCRFLTRHHYHHALCDLGRPEIVAIACLTKPLTSNSIRVERKGPEFLNVVHPQSIKP